MIDLLYISKYYKILIVNQYFPSGMRVEILLHRLSHSNDWYDNYKFEVMKSRAPWQRDRFILTGLVAELNGTQEWNGVLND